MNFAMITAVNLHTLTAGQRLVVTNAATDPGPARADVDVELADCAHERGARFVERRVFWRPTIAQSPSSNFISLRVTDDGTPRLAATQCFSVLVRRPITPTLSAPTLGTGGFGLSVAGDGGPDYTILTSTNLVQWTPLLTTTPSVLPFGITDPAARTNDLRFYRVRLEP